MTDRPLSIHTVGPVASGQIRRRTTKRGINYSIRVRYQGERITHPVGGSWEGWTEPLVERERDYVTAQIERGEYIPPAAAATPQPPARAETAQTFQVFASVVLARWRRRAAPKTAADLEWRLRTAMDHFGQLTLDEISVAHVDEFVDWALRDRDAIEQARAADAPLMESYEDARTGRTHQRRRRGLSNSSINKVLSAVRRVLKEAVRHGLIESNVLDDRDCFVRAQRPSRSFLQVPQIEAVMRGGKTLEDRHRGLGWPEVEAIRESSRPATHLAREYRVSDTLIRKIRRREVWVNRPEPRRRHDISRVAILGTLFLAGPRISELCELDGTNIDFPQRVIHMPRVKTDASMRVVPMVPALHQLLLAHREAHGWGSTDPVFATRNGTRNTPDNIRRRVIEPAHEEAMAITSRDGTAEIAHLTPHTFRRTFASLLAELGVSPRRAMYLLGHTDAKLTMNVYQQVLDLHASDVSLLQTTLGCDLDEAFAIYSAREFTPAPSAARTSAAADLQH